MPFEKSRKNKQYRSGVTEPPPKGALFSRRRMPLALTVSLVVLAAVAVVGLLGYWIDKNDENDGLS